MQVEISNTLIPGTDHRLLELTPDTPWPSQDLRGRALLVSLNTPGYYSLAVRILALTSALSGSVNGRFDVRYVESDIDQDTDGLARAISAWRPDVIALSVNIWNVRQSLALARELKQALPGSSILVGGQEVTGSVTDILAEHSAVDYVVDGEGEIPFLQFLAAWDPAVRALPDPPDVSGLQYRGNGKVLSTGPSLTVADLDDLPSPILAGLVPVNSKNKLGVMLEGARGCPYQCSFCFEGSRTIKVRMASIERLSAEARHMASQGASYFHLLDPILCNSRPERLKGIADLFKDLNRNRKMQISLETYAQHIHDGIAQYLADFTIIDVGLQSINPETQKEIRRSFSKDRFRQGLDSLRKVNPNFNLYLICGLPHETLRSFLQGVEFVLAERPARIFINELCLLNGTELRRRAAHYGYDFDPAPPYWVSASAWMDRWELKLAHVLSKIVVKRYNLSLRALFPLAPWVRNAPPPSGRRISLRLDSGSQTTELNAAGGADVEIIVPGELAGSSALQRLLGQLQLVGAARITLVAPPAAFADPLLVERLIALGALQFTVVPMSGTSDALTPVANLVRAFNMKGYAAIIPFSEIVVPAGGSDINDYRRRVDDACRSGADLVTIPGAVQDLGDAWIDAAADLFRRWVQDGKWVRVPRLAAERGLGTLPERGAVVSLMERLGLLSGTPGSFVQDGTG